MCGVSVRVHVARVACIRACVCVRMDLGSGRNVMLLSAVSASGFSLLSCVIQLTTIFRYQPVSQIQEVVCSCPEGRDDSLGSKFITDYPLEGVSEEYSVALVGTPLHVFTFLLGITFLVAALSLCSYSPCRCRSVREVPDQHVVYRSRTERLREVPSGGRGTFSRAPALGVCARYSLGDRNA